MPVQVGENCLTATFEFEISYKCVIFGLIKRDYDGVCVLGEGRAGEGRQDASWWWLGRGTDMFDKKTCQDVCSGYSSNEMVILIGMN